MAELVSLSWPVLVLISFSSLLVLLALGVPVGFSLGLAGLICLLLFAPPRTITQLSIVAYNLCSSFELVSLPLFIFMAEVLLFTNITADLFEVMRNWVGHLPGGLGIAAVGACGGFGAVCGSACATTATVGLIALPEMRKRGYDGGMAAAMVAAGGPIGMIIPPSNVAIIYCVVTQTSIGKVFMAGWIPGLLIVMTYSIYIAIFIHRFPRYAPTVPRAPIMKSLRTTYRMWPILALSALVMGAIYLGIATPTESAGVGCSATLILAVLYRKLNWNNLRSTFLNTASATCYIYLIMVGALIFGYALTYLDVTRDLTNWVVSMNLNRWGFMISVYALFFFLGMLIEPASIMLIILPTVFPITQAFGFDPVWFGIVCVVNCMLGNITPPVGLSLFVAHRIVPDVPQTDLMKKVWPFVGCLLLVEVAISVFPQIVLVLPNTMA